MIVIIKMRKDMRAMPFDGNKFETGIDENSSKGSRNISLRITGDKIKAYITILYSGQSSNDKDQNDVPLYTTYEIKDALSKQGINYGIIEENLKKCSECRKISDLIIAEGLQSEDDTEDIIDIKFKSEQGEQVLEEDEHGRIDYRKIGNITSVNKGDIIAIRKIGKLGHDGIDIYGRAKVGKKKKKVPFRAGEGCTIKEDNVIVSLIEGKPCMKNNTFYVYPSYSMNKDVSLETGDIKFVGDINIHGNVKEGMTVEAGNVLTIEGNIEGSKISARGGIVIKGNAITTSITAGGKDIWISKYIDDLQETKKLLNMMIEAIVSIRKGNLLGDKISDGEVIKLLIENKFKELPKLFDNIIKDTYEYNNGENDVIVDLIKGRLKGTAVLLLKHYRELDFIISTMSKRIEELEDIVILPANVSIAYCQNANVYSSGDILVTGVGEYVSNLTANRGIYFSQEGSVARGGILQANNEVVCKVVGSQGGVKTSIIVGKKGQINIGVAYQNTTITVGKKEYLFNVPCYNVHAYLNEEHELVVDKFNM